MNERAVIGGNLPPDPIDELCAAYEGPRMEAENWLDGQKVENEDQMNAVDALRKDMRECRLALEKGQKSASAPMYDAYKSEIARWKPTIEDIQHIEKGLVSLLDGFKRKLAAEKEEARRKAEAEAWEKTRAAQEAARAADASNIEQARAAAQAQAEAKAAQKAAQAASKDTVKGMRTVTRYKIDSHKEALNDIAINDRDAITAFIEKYVHQNHKLRDIKGVSVWAEKEAF